jgi:hypothetical protein
MGEPAEKIQTPSFPKESSSAMSPLVFEAQSAWADPSSLAALRIRANPCPASSVDDNDPFRGNQGRFPAATADAREDPVMPRTTWDYAEACNRVKKIRF